MTQQDKILKYIEQYGSITTMEAFSILGCTRLSAQVFELKGKGYPIKTSIVETTNRFGERKRYASYTLENN